MSIWDGHDPGDEDPATEVSRAVIDLWAFVKICWPILFPGQKAELNYTTEMILEKIR